MMLPNAHRECSQISVSSVAGSAVLEAPALRGSVATARVPEQEPEPEGSGGDGGGGKKSPPSGGGGDDSDSNEWREDFFQWWENHNPFSKYGVFPLKLFMQHSKLHEDAMLIFVPIVCKIPFLAAWLAV